MQGGREGEREVHTSLAAVRMGALLEKRSSSPVSS